MWKVLLERGERVACERGGVGEERKVGQHQQWSKQKFAQKFRIYRSII